MRTLEEKNVFEDVWNKGRILRHTADAYSPSPVLHRSASGVPLAPIRRCDQFQALGARVCAPRTLRTERPSRAAKLAEGHGKVMSHGVMASVFCQFFSMDRHCPPVDSQGTQDFSSRVFQG